MPQWGGGGEGYLLKWAMRCIFTHADTWISKTIVSKPRYIPFSHCHGLLHILYRQHYYLLFLPLLIDELSLVNNMWLQQDNATLHTARATITILKNAFLSSILTFFFQFDLHWHASFPDLNASDFFLRVFCKSFAQTNKSQA